MTVERPNTLAGLVEKSRIPPDLDILRGKIMAIVRRLGFIRGDTERMELADRVARELVGAWADRRFGEMLDRGDLNDVFKAVRTQGRAPK